MTNRKGKIILIRHWQLNMM